MSSNHKAPLTAFVVVAIACVVVLATSSMRSYARDAWRSFSAPVVDGLSLIHRDGAHPVAPRPATQTLAVGRAVERAGDPIRPARHHERLRQGSTSATATTTAQIVKDPPRTIATTPPVPTVVPPAPPLLAPPARPADAAVSHGQHRGWGHGEHLGWTKVPAHGLPSGTTKQGRGHGAGNTSAQAMSDASWQHGLSHGAKSAKPAVRAAKASGARGVKAGKADKAKGNAVRASFSTNSVPSAAHGNRNGNGEAKGNNGRGFGIGH